MTVAYPTAEASCQSHAVDEYITFHVGRHEFAIERHRVLAAGPHAIAVAARSPKFVGHTQPKEGRPQLKAVDIHDRLGLARDGRHYAVTILVQVAQCVFALVADAVWDVVRLRGQQMHRIGHKHPLRHARWIKGMVTSGSRQMLVVDADRLFARPGSFATDFSPLAS